MKKDKSPGRGPSKKPTKTDEIVRLAKEGLTSRQIARRTGYNFTSIQTIMYQQRDQISDRKYLTTPKKSSPPAAPKKKSSTSYFEHDKTLLC